MSHMPLPLRRWGASAGPVPIAAPMGKLRTLRNYVALTDLRSTSLLVFTAVAAGVIGGGLHTPVRLVVISLALAISCMGARTVANYIDRDIDALMERTRRRPLPSGAVEPAHALYMGLGLVVLGICVSLVFGPLVAAIIAVGLADNLVVYALLTKRTSPLNIVLGAPSGGAPAFVGYLAVTGHLDPMAFVLAGFVVLWTPIHIWSLAIRFKDDYARANVPMLPVAVGVRRSAQYVGLASLAFGALAGLFIVAGGVDLLPPVSAILLALAVGLIAGSVWLVRSPTAGHAWALFKFTSPYLALLFTLLAINAILVR
jgi:heme o synthase